MKNMCGECVIHTFMVLLCATPVGCHPIPLPSPPVYFHIARVSLRFSVISDLTDSARKTHPRGIVRTPNITSIERNNKKKSRVI